MKCPAAVAMAALALVCCSMTAAPSKTPSAAPDIASAAADLRVHIDLLLGEHVYIVAKLMTAASAGRSEEYRSYAVLLATNGGDLTEVFSNAVGAGAGERFAKVWAEGNDYTVDYIVASATHNANSAQTAAAKMASVYVPDMTQFLTSDVGIAVDRSGLLAGVETDGLRSLLDDQGTGNFAKTYPDLLLEYAQSTSLGDEIGINIANRFADRFPGDSISDAVGHRAKLGALLQEQAYLSTMATEATLAGATAEPGAAGSALAGVNSAVAQETGAVLGAAAGPAVERALKDRTAALLAYAAAADEAQRHTQSTILTGSGAAALAAAMQLPKFNVSEQAGSAIKVVDGQRAKIYQQISLDDRSAASFFAMFADVITGASFLQ